MVRLKIKTALAIVMATMALREAKERHDKERSVVVETSNSKQIQSGSYSSTADYSSDRDGNRRVLSGCSFRAFSDSHYLTTSNYCEKTVQLSLEDPEVFDFQQEDEYVEWTIHLDYVGMYTFILEVQNDIPWVSESLSFVTISGVFYSYLLPIPDNQAGWVLVPIPVELQETTATVLLLAGWAGWKFRRAKIRYRACGLSFQPPTSLTSPTTLNTFDYCASQGVTVSFFYSPLHYFHYVEADGFVAWDVFVLESGTYNFEFTYHSGQAGEIQLCQLVGDCCTGQIYFPTTGGSQMTVQHTATLLSGEQTLKMQASSWTGILFSIHVSRVSETDAPLSVPSSTPIQQPNDWSGSNCWTTQPPHSSSSPSQEPSNIPFVQPIGSSSDAPEQSSYTISPIAKVPSATTPHNPSEIPNVMPVTTTGAPFGIPVPIITLPPIPATTQPTKPTPTPVGDPIQRRTQDPTGSPSVMSMPIITLPTKPPNNTPIPTIRPQTGGPIGVTPILLPIPRTAQPTGAPNSTPPPSRSDTDTPVSFTIPATTQPSGAPNVISIPTTMQPTVAPNSTPGPTTTQPSITPNNTPVPTTRLPTTVPFSQTSPAPDPVLVVIDDLPTQRPSSPSQVRQLTSQPSSWRPTTKPSDSSTPPMPIPPTPPPSSTLAPTPTTQSPESSGSNSPSMYPTFAYSIARSIIVIARLSGVGELSLVEIATFLEISEIWLEENYNEYFTTQTLNKIRDQQQRGSRRLERRREARLIQVKLEFVSQAVTLRNDRPTNTLTYNEVITYSSREAVQNFGPDTLRSAVLGDPDHVESLIARLKEAIPSMSELEDIVLMPRKVEDSSGLSDWGWSGILLSSSFIISFGSLMIYSWKLSRSGAK